MKKNKLIKFISVFQIILFVALTLVAAITLAIALFEKFEVTAPLDFINDKLWFVEEMHLYVVNFFETIYLSLEVANLEFLADILPKITPYLHIIYTGLFTFITLLCLIFAIVCLKAAKGKSKGRGGVITAFILNFIVGGAFTAYMVYYIMNAEAVKTLITPLATATFALEGFEYSELLSEIIIYAIAGTTAFFALFYLIGLFTSKKGESASKSQKQSNKDMGSYKPRMKPKEEDNGILELTPNKTAEYMKFQDSKSSNPYINGDAKLTEDDLFADLNKKPELKPEPKPEPVKPAQPMNNPFFSAPKPATPSPYTQQPSAFGQQNQFNAFNRPQPNPFQSSMQNSFMQPTPAAAPAPTPAPQNAPTNINLTISPMAAMPNQQAVPMQVVQTPVSAAQQVPVQTVPTRAAAQRTAAKSANEAYKPKPKPTTQAVARTRATDQNLTDKLKELSALRQSGAISDDEYKALKQKAFQKFLKS